LSGKSIKFLCDEWETVDQAIVYLRENLEELPPWRYQSLASSGAVLGDIYKTVESTLRTLVEKIEGRKLNKDDRWHKALLEKGYEYEFIPKEHYKTIREMLGFRHVIVHGYSIKLNEESIRQGAPEAINAFYGFVDHIRTKFDIPFEFSTQSPSTED